MSELELGSLVVQRCLCCLLGMCVFLVVRTLFATVHCIKPTKMHILRKVIEYLGHLSTPTGTMPTSKHVDAILHMPPPLGPKLGMMIWWTGQS
mgnify:CR=1 FL=1